MTSPIFAVLLTSAACLLPAGDERQSAQRAGNPLQALAGAYYFGDGLGSNHTLRITPEGQYEYELHGCLGLYDCDNGRAEVVVGHLILTPVKFNVRRIVLSLSMLNEGLLGFSRKYCEMLLQTEQLVVPDDVLDAVLRELVADIGDVTAALSELHEEFVSAATPTDFLPIRWGERLFLVPTSEGKKFCDCVNLGLFSYLPHGNFYMRRGDEKKKGDGLPSVPAEWKPMLLANPLQGTVVEVLANAPARVNFGAESGAWKGMMLRIDSDYGRAEVVEVDAKTCVIQVHHDDHRVAIGRSVHSRKPEVK